jgi:NAD-dependent SIR2 family protein deacetylase
MRGYITPLNTKSQSKLFHHSTSAWLAQERVVQLSSGVAFNTAKKGKKVECCSRNIRRSARGSNRRPAVVWFGEELPTEALEKSCRALEACNLFFSIGTSAVVQPAASFLNVARDHGAKTAEVNLNATRVSQLADWSILGRAGEALPELVRRAFNE